MNILSVKEPVNVKASLWTIGVHVLLLLLLLWIKYGTPPVPDIQEEGMEVNLGTDENGYGTSQPMAVEDPAPDAASVSYVTRASESSTTREILTTDNEDAPAVSPATTGTRAGRSETRTDNRRPNDRQALNNNNTRQQRPRYVYGGATGRGGNSAPADAPGTNEGNTTGNGDRGVPSGTPGASNYTGIPGSGNGISHNLSRRNIIAFPPPEADFKEGGKVTVRITVNKAGNITNKQVISASNAEIRAIALRKIEKIKFNKSDDAPEEQFGNITFVFKTRS